MIAAFAAALLQPPDVPSPPVVPPPIFVPRPTVAPPPQVPIFPFPAPRAPAPPPPPYGPRPDIVVDSVYSLECRVAAEDGATFELKAKASGRGAERRMAIESEAPDRFPSGTAAGEARRRNWPADEHVEIFTLDRQDSVYTLSLGWVGGRLSEAALTVLRPGAERPFGSPGAVTCRRR